MVFSIMHKKNKGFTLVEIVLVVAIFAIIIIAISSFGGDMFRYNRIVGNSLSAQQEARQAIKMFSAELRAAQYSENGSYPLGEVLDNSFTFYSDYDKDGEIEQIKYYLSNDKLLYATTEPSGSPAVYTSAPNLKTLVTGINNGGTPIFSYYDSTYSGSSSALSQPVNANDVRLVKINLLIDQDPNSPPLPISVTTQVVVRNLKDNL